MTDRLFVSPPPPPLIPFRLLFFLVLFFRPPSLCPSPTFSKRPPLPTLLFLYSNFSGHTLYWKYCLKIPKALLCIFPPLSSRNPEPTPTGVYNDESLLFLLGPCVPGFFLLMSLHHPSIPLFPFDPHSTFCRPSPSFPSGPENAITRLAYTPRHEISPT